MIVKNHIIQRAINIVSLLMGIIIQNNNVLTNWECRTVNMMDTGRVDSGIIVNRDH